MLPTMDPFSNRYMILVRGEYTRADPSLRNDSEACDSISCIETTEELYRA